MKLNNDNKTRLRIRRIKSWLRSPRYYLQKGYERIFNKKIRINCEDRACLKLGSREWFVASEMAYGGLQTGLISKRDQGGDRMSPEHHDYACCYEEFIRPFINQTITLVEVGILNGTGLAIWCDLFPDSRIIGLDINIDNYLANKSFLLKQGAFAKNNPEVYTFDQLDKNSSEKLLKKVLRTGEVKICIDDGLHTIQAIESTFKMMIPYLSSRFAYFIEDNYDTYDVLAHKYPEFKWTTRGEITVIINRRKHAMLKY